MRKAPELASLLDLLSQKLADMPRPTQTDAASEDNPFSTPAAQSEAPAALLLLPRLFLTYELNPVNEKAQSMVALPDGLDLHSWIVPNCLPALPVLMADEDVDDYGRPKGGFGVVSSSSSLHVNGSAASQKPRKSKKDKSRTDGKKSKRVSC